MPRTDNLDSLSTLISSNWVRILIWSIFFIFFAILTILDLLPLLSRYQHENIATQITVVKPEFKHRPEVAVCLPYHSGSLTTITTWINRSNDSDIDSDQRNQSDRSCLECEGLQNHSWGVWDTTENASQFSETHLTNALITKTFEDPNPEKLLELNSTNFNWNQPLVDSIWRFFACVGMHDIRNAMRSRSATISRLCEKVNVSNFQILPKQKIDKIYKSLLNAVDNYFEIESIIAGFDDEEIRNAKQKISSGLRDRENAMTIKGDHFCLKIPRNSTDEKFSYNGYPDHDSPPWIRSPRPENFLIFEDDSDLYGYSGGNFEPIYPTKNDHAILNGGSQIYVTLSFAVDYTVIETRSDAPCHKIDTSLVTCLAQRFQEHAILQCACIPFTYRHLITSIDSIDITDFPYCTADRYQKCRDRWDENFENHKITCTSKCDYTFLEWKIYKHPELIKRDSKSISFRVKIVELPEPFVEFTITIKDSFEQFLAQIGGVANLYLGYSGMSVCVLVIFAVEWLMEKYRKRTPPLNQWGEDKKEEADKKRDIEFGSVFYPQDQILSRLDEKIDARMGILDDRMKKMEEKLMEMAKKGKI